MSRLSVGLTRKLLLAGVLLAASATARGDDWPEIRGKGRLGIWTETSIVEKFPAAGLNVLWRTPLGAGFSGPSVANGRVFVMDFSQSGTLRCTERAVALDEKSGKILWTREWPADYRGMMYAYGPRATPTVDDDRVYFAGADGKLLCLKAATGAIVWKKDYVLDYGADRSRWKWDWGFASSPLVDGNRLIALVGGQPDAKVVAFDKLTGKEVWRALSSEEDLGVAQPIIITSGGARQLIVWYPGAVVSLDPVTGRKYWEQPSKVHASMTVPTPVLSGSMLFFTSFYNGGLMLELDQQKPAATLLWKGKSESEIDTDGLHGVITTPVIMGGHIYGLCSYGQFRCLVAKTGQRVWESQAVTKERARWASGLIVTHGDNLFINNDRGELIIVRPNPTGYEEVSRTQLLKPTSSSGNRRQLGAVNWSYPAYANRRIYARNDEEIIAASLAADGR